MSQKKYASLQTLQTFLDNLKTTFSALSHKHTVSDITDYTVDTVLSSTSSNPVQNKVVNAEFDAIAEAMGALESEIDSKAEECHNHTASDIEFDAPAETDPIATRGSVDDALCGIENYITNNVSLNGHTHAISNVTNLQTTLDAKVPTSRTINNKALTANISLSASDVGADASGSANAVQENLDTHTSNADIHFTSAERTKLSGIAEGAQVNTVTGVKGSSESSYRTGNINITKANIGLGSVDNTSDANKPVSTAQQTAIDASLASAKSYTDSKTANLASTSSVDNKISTHNTETTAHNDIRDLISGLTTRLNTLANSDDTTLDQMSEIVDYIKNNKSLIDGITTSKVNVSDIIDNLTTNVSNKPLSAAQGVAIKTLIDALQEELDSHGHVIADVSGLQTALDGKANSSHGVHVSYSTAAPVMDGTASVGTASTVARSDHKHPTDTSRASKTEFDTHVNNADVHFTTTEREKLSGIAEGAQVNVQSDWNVNDASDDSYVKNRPFWTDDPVETQLVNSASLNTTEYDENIYVSRSPFSFELVEGAQYDVTWNGTVYSCTCRLLSGALNIGNASILGLGENTQEPFFIDYYSGANSVYTSSATSATVSIVGHISEVHKINNKYIDFPDGSYVGVANDNFGEVFNDYANNVSSGTYSHSEGFETTATGDISHAEGYGTTASGNFSHAEGADTIASGHWSHAEGYDCDATGRMSHAEGHGTVAASEVQHVQGRFNMPDTANKYAHIVGNGTSSTPANIHTLDWDGYAWFERGIYVGGSGMDDASATRVTTEADHNWTLIYDSGEIPEIANSISNIDVSGYANFEILVRCYNDGDSLGPGDRAGAVIFTAQNGKSYQFPVWTDMLSKSISTVSAMAQFKLIDGWLVCPYASKLIDFVDVFDTAEGGTAGNLVPSGSGMMRCTSPLSTLTISSYGQSSNFYFGVGSRVMVWGWNA